MKNKRTKWIQKHEADELENKNLPIPTQVLSNEEFFPFEQTSEQAKVEHCLLEIADESAKKLNISRRKFLATSGGMAAAFLAMNSVFGNLFDVSAQEVFESSATAEKFPKKPFIFDIHTHQSKREKLSPNRIWFVIEKRERLGETRICRVKSTFGKTFI